MLKDDLTNANETGLKQKDPIRILVGVYAGKEGTVNAISDTEKPLGVHLPGERMPLIWFKSEEVEKLR